MKNSVNIVEICESGTGAGLFNYDLLPDNVKSAVDRALEAGSDGIGIDIYEDGLQFLYGYQEKKPDIEFEIKKGESSIFMGTAYLYG